MRLYSWIRYSDLKHNQFVQLLVAGEAATEGVVVEAEGGVGYQDVEGHYTQGYRPCVGKGVVAGFYHPVVEEVHHGVMGNVERKGNIAQEAAEARGEGVGGSAGCSEPHEQGEDEQDAD